MCFLEIIEIRLKFMIITKNIEENMGVWSLITSATADDRFNKQDYIHMTICPAVILEFKYQCIIAVVACVVIYYN